MFHAVILLPLVFPWCPSFDEHVGQIIKQLKDAGVYDNTILILSSDNGAFNEGGADCEFFDSNAPFKNEYGWGKGFLYEGGIREPLIVAWPGKIKPGTTSDLLTATSDFFPTVCQLINISSPKNINGVSILPTVLGQPQKQQKHPSIYWEFPQYGGQQAVHVGKWKGIRFNMQQGNMKIKLFDLDNDIQEQRDIADDHLDIVKQIEEIMKKEHKTPLVYVFRIKGLDD